MKQIDSQPRITLTERGRFARDSIIVATGIGFAALTISNIANSEQPPADEIACTTQLLQPNLEAFSNKYLGADTPAEKKQMASHVARQSRINNPSNVNFEQDLSLTSEQCLLVVGNGGEVTYFEPSDQ